MKTRLVIIAAFLLGLCSPAFAQREWSVELSTSPMPPLHILLSNPGERLAEKGQDFSDRSIIAISLSGVWRFKPHSELVLSAGFSCDSYDLTQYATFGIDPKGNPRYDLNDSHYAGRGHRLLGPTVTARYRYLWNPERTLVAYSELGLGIGTVDGVSGPIPAVTPIGIRVRGRHFYAFAENAFSAISFCLSLGLGWKF